MRASDEHHSLHPVGLLDRHVDQHDGSRTMTDASDALDSQGIEEPEHKPGGFLMRKIPWWARRASEAWQIRYDDRVVFAQFVQERIPLPTGDSKAVE